ncbi:MAG TPA: 50S ribosomal protein L15e [Candidatus Nanoarchaeia archaeon]|nr:50S ribosomal protein L15e [Candidatus Nanoarchaeia archaeon]
MGMYRYLSEMVKDPSESVLAVRRDRLVNWRAEPVLLRIERPTHLARARALGYRAKKGVVLVRVRVVRGGKQRPSIRHGRRSRNLGQRFVMGKSYQWIAEERANKRFSNLEVLNSYKVGKDGVSYWFEVIMVDPEHPAVKADPRLNVLKHTGRVFRGLTSAGKKGRGHLYKGKGVEKNRPSLNAKKDLGK